MIIVWVGSFAGRGPTPGAQDLTGRIAGDIGAFEADFTLSAVVYEHCSI